MFNLLLIPFALILMTVGILSYPMPVPGSTILTVTGLGLLLIASPWFRDRVRGGRRRWDRFDRTFAWLEAHSKGRFAEALEETRPEPAGSSDTGA